LIFDLGGVWRYTCGGGGTLRAGALGGGGGVPTGRVFFLFRGRQIFLTSRAKN